MLLLKKAAGSTLAVILALHRSPAHEHNAHITEFSEATGVVTSLNLELVVQTANFI